MRAILFAALIVAAVSARAEGEAPAERYSLRHDDWRSWAWRPPEATNSFLPYDKVYHELTPRQQDFLKSMYEKMGPGDEPPYPANGMGPLVRQIIKAQSKLQVEGNLTMFVQIDSAGKPVSVQVLEAPSAEMARVAGSLLMFETYKPALCAGTPCAMQFPFRFELLLR